MLGNYVNFLAILGGSLLGLLLKRGLQERYKAIVMQGIGLAVLFIGAKGALAGLLDPAANPILFIISLVLGGLAGEYIRIEEALQRFGFFLQRSVGQGDGNVAQGFVTASLLFCVGTMAIVGSLESGLRGNHDMLFAKSVLDGVTSIVLASSLGLGVIFSAGAVFLYQGAIVLFAGTVEPYLTAQIIREVSIVGGILILGIGMNILEIKQVKTGNLLPAILVPPLFYLVIIPLVKYFANIQV